ncbi:pseudouridine synthase [Chitinimonas lacunae]|uniref:tRNA pseudouridine synthase C n=1 Tax=Chitinimonas lacunae TaxID=1963018 RepID=A0ABV8MPP6_9NEIS
MKETLPLIYQDEHLVAVHKPSGLLIHRSEIDRHETRFALQIVRDQIGRHVHAVHRLDKGTSGLLLFALSPEAASRLGRLFEEGGVDKRYLAVVRGWPEAAGQIDHPLSRRVDDYEQRTPAVNAPPQAALTRFRRLATVELPIEVERYPTSRYALVELDPVTGRRHQLRRHLKHLSHPIIGDATYGKGRHNRMFAEQFGSHRLLLACTMMRFAHPLDGRELTLACPLAEDFQSLLNRLPWQPPYPSAQ